MEVVAKLYLFYFVLFLFIKIHGIKNIMILKESEKTLEIHKNP